MSVSRQAVLITAAAGATPRRGSTGLRAIIRARKAARPARTGEDPGASMAGGPSARVRSHTSHDRRNVDLGDQEGPRPDAQGRRHHGRRHARSGQDRRGRRRRRRDGPRARPGRYPRRGRRRPDERSLDDRGDHERRHDPGDGQGPDRAFRRGPGARGARRRLHRRVRGPDAGRRDQPHRQARRSRFRSCAAAATWARRSGGSTKARR